MPKPMQISKSFVRQACRQEIRQAEKEGTITFSVQEFKALIRKIEKDARYNVSSAYRQGYINAP